MHDNKTKTFKQHNEGASTSTDMLYLPGDPVFGIAGPMIAAQGWSVFPQERKGRYPSRVNDKSFEWSLVMDRLPTADEMADFCRDAPQSNVAAAMGEGSGRIFCLDIDCMDAVVSDRVQEIALEHLGYTPFIRIGRKPKSALFYRYADIKPRNSKMELADHADCFIEVQGHGKAMTIYGMHHVTGRYFFWPDLMPLSSSPSEAPEVTSEQLEGFMNAVRSEFKVSAGTRAVSSSNVSSDFNSEVSDEGLNVPSVGMEDDKLKDGREKYLTDITWNLVWRNQEAVRAASDAGEMDAMSIRLTDLAQKCFVNMCEMNGKWTQHHLRTNAGSKIGSAVAKCLTGNHDDMKPYVAPKPKKAKAAAPCADDVADAEGKACVHLVEGDLGRTVDAVEALLIERGAQVYQRAGMLVRIARETSSGAGGLVSRTVVNRVTRFVLADIISRHVLAARHDSKTGDWRPCDMPMTIIDTLLERVGAWKFPTLAAVLTCPTLRSDGSLMQTEGYDADTGFFLQFDGRGYDIPDRPTRADAMDALKSFDVLLGGFPFVDEQDKSVCLATILTALVRRSVPYAPVFAFTATAPGSGKGKLVNIASILATGGDASTIEMGSNADEMDKRIHAQLLKGASHLALDELKKPLGGPLYQTMTTSMNMEVRVLGESRSVLVSTNFLVTVTGNQLSVAADMVRRCMLCRLDAKMERPYERQFDSDPEVVSRVDRVDYVRAALVIMRAFAVSGDNVQMKSLGNFDPWSQLVCRPLVWLGMANPQASLEILAEGDPRAAEHRAVLTQWRTVIGAGKKITSKGLIDAAVVKVDKADWRSPFKNDALREALLEATDETGHGGGAINSKALGQWLKRNAGAYLDGMRILRGPLRDGLATWYLDSQDAIVDSDKDTDSSKDGTVVHMSQVRDAAKRLSMTDRSHTQVALMNVARKHFGDKHTAEAWLGTYDPSIGGEPGEMFGDAMALEAHLEALGNSVGVSASMH